MIQKINSIEEYHSEYKKSVDNPESFWAEKADTFQWKKKWDNVLEWDFHNYNVKWFEGGQLNITENIIVYVHTITMIQTGVSTSPTVKN